MGKLTKEVFNESCCDGGATCNSQSAQPCGCDPGEGWTCKMHKESQQYIVKDSGKRMEFDSGMVRDVTEGKVDYSLVYDGPMLDRWAEHLTKGATKYAARNWMKAEGEAERERFMQSAARHFRQWLRGDTDEDHAAAVMFNINGAEYTKEKLTYERTRQTRGSEVDLAGEPQPGIHRRERAETVSPQLHNPSAQPDGDNREVGVVDQVGKEPSIHPSGHRSVEGDNGTLRCADRSGTILEGPRTNHQPPVAVRGNDGGTTPYRGPLLSGGDTYWEYSPDSGYRRIA